MLLMINGKKYETKACNLAELVATKDNMPEYYALALNGEIISKVNFENTNLHDGDEIEIFVMMAGG
ncbi:MAG: sulfur carrier protein ThiS [Succinivibrionaceae bacterium]